MRIREVSFPVLVGMAVLCSSCTTVQNYNPFDLSVKEGRHCLIVSTDSSGGWGVASHPFLCRISSDSIAATYNLVGDGKRKGNNAPAAWPVYYDLLLESWQFGNPYVWQLNPPEDIQLAIQKGELVGKKNPYSEGVFYGGIQFPDGRMINYSRRAAAPDYTLRSFVSTNWGAEWTDNGLIPFSFPEGSRRPPAMIVENEGVVLDDGMVLQVGYHRIKGDNKYSTFLFSSTDGGQSYALKSIVAGPDDTPWGGEGPCEPALVQCDNGDLLCMMRTGHDETKSVWSEPNAYGDMLSARSSDGGKTWQLERTLLKGVMPKLLRMSNGVMVCAFGRPGNNLVFSLDDGRTWGHELAITPMDIKTTGYLDLVEVEPGKLLVVYDMYDSDTNGIWLWEPVEQNGVFGCFVEVKKR